MTPEEKAAADAMNSGVGFARLNPDGSVEHLPPERVVKSALDCAMDELERVTALWRESEQNSRDFQQSLHRLLYRIEKGLPLDDFIPKVKDHLRRKGALSVLRDAADGRRPAHEVTNSCGCVYCDLGLDPDIEIEGVKFHHAPRRGNTLCERKSSIAPAS